MIVHVGVKSDPIENRYSFDWLFAVMAEQHVGWLQLGSSFPFFHADEAWFRDLRRKAERRGIRIHSTYTSYREMTGFFSGDSHLEAASRHAWERLIRVAAWVGASSAGSAYRLSPSCPITPWERASDDGWGSRRALTSASPRMKSSKPSRACSLRKGYGCTGPGRRTSANTAILR